MINCKKYKYPVDLDIPSTQNHIEYLAKHFKIYYRCLGLCASLFTPFFHNHQVVLNHEPNRSMNCAFRLALIIILSISYSLAFFSQFFLKSQQISRLLFSPQMIGFVSFIFTYRVRACSVSRYGSTVTHPCL
jgi:hypothetical protein